MADQLSLLGRGQETAPPAGRKPDLLVVGGGSAGFSAAIAAAEAGARVVIAGEGTLGGTCVNVGCVPSKALIRAMEAVHAGKAADRFEGVRGTTAIVDWKALVRQKQNLIHGLRKAKYEDLLPEYPNISYVHGRARFTGDGTELELDGALYHAGKVILATGSSPAMPEMDGMRSVPVLDSARALEMETLPESLLILGGGAVGVELGQMFARAGVKVTLCCRRRLLPQAEPEVSDALAGYLRQEGVTIHAGVGYRKIEQRGHHIALTCMTPKGERVVEAERVLAATGRRPNTGNLGLERTAIRLGGNGGVAVNEFLQTSHPEVYAAGDVTGRDMFVYMAAYAGKLAARNALGGNTRRYKNETMPSVVFTDPQVATVGLIEAEARAEGHEVKTSLLPLATVPRYAVARDTRGLLKLIANAKTDKLLGATILAPEAGDSIQTVVMALKAGMTTEELGDTIFPYLTGVEGVKLAAQGFRRDVKKLSCCAG